MHKVPRVEPETTEKIAQSLPSGQSALGRLATWLERHEAAVLLAVFLLALAMRLAYLALFVGLDAPPAYDGVEYDYLAHKLLAGEGYAGPYGPTAFRPPLYPFLLAGLYATAGRSFATVRIAHALLGAASCLLLYGLTKALTGRAVALTAALGAAFYPLLLYMAGILYAETLFLFLLLGAVWLLARAVDRHQTGAAAACGVVLGLAILAKAGAAAFLPFAFLTLWLAVPGRGGWRQGLWMTGCALLVLLPWILRNRAVLGGVTLATEGGVTLWAANNPLARGGQVEPGPDTWNGPPPAPDLGFHGWSALGERGSSAAFAAQALRWMREHPADFLGSLPARAARLWSPAEYMVRSGRARSERFARLLWVPYALFLGLAALGIAITRRDGRRLSMLYGLIAATTVGALLTGGGTRFSLPMVPALLFFAAVGCVAIVRRSRSIVHRPSSIIHCPRSTIHDPPSTL